MKVFVILALVAVVAAEPPVPDSYGMLPPARNAPSSSYGPPSHQQHNHGGLTGARFTGFGSAPRMNHHQHQAPSSRYGAPSASAPAPRYAAPAPRAPAPVYGAPSEFGGYPNSRNAFADDMSEPASYGYKYEVNDDQSGSEFGHQEEREGDTAHGEYRVLLPDGRTQVVTYEADERGYRPTITYLESEQGGYPRGPANDRHGGPY